MKNFSILLLLFPFLMNGQIAETIGEKNNSEYYINSEKVDLDKTYINNNSIESLTVSKDEDSKKYYIKLKKGIVLSDLKNLELKNEKTLDDKIYFIDKKLIKDPASIIIDKYEIENAEIINSSEIANISENFSIINISTYSFKQNLQTEKTLEIKQIK